MLFVRDSQISNRNPCNIVCVSLVGSLHNTMADLHLFMKSIIVIMNTARGLKEFVNFVARMKNRNMWKCDINKVTNTNK